MTAAIEYTEEIAATICGRLAEGESLKAICETEGVPSLKVVYRWLASNPNFLALYQQAREDQADTLADEMLEIADDKSGDINEKGEVDHDVIARARLRVDTRKFLASKLKPKKYGDKLAIGGASDLPRLDEPVDIVTLARRIAFILSSAEHQLANRRELLLIASPGQSEGDESQASD